MEEAVTTEQPTYKPTKMDLAYEIYMANIHLSRQRMIKLIREGVPGMTMAGASTYYDRCKKIKDGGYSLKKKLMKSDELRHDLLTKGKVLGNALKNVNEYTPPATPLAQRMIPPVEVFELARTGSNQQDIIAALAISKQVFDEMYLDAYEQGTAARKITLAATMYKVGIGEKNVKMLTHLGQQDLGQASDEKGTVNININVDSLREKLRGVLLMDAEPGVIEAKAESNKDQS